MASRIEAESNSIATVRRALVEVARCMTEAFACGWLVTVPVASSHVLDEDSTEPFGAYDGTNERHRTGEICLCVHGAMAVRIGDQCHRLSEGEAAFVPPMSPHEERAILGRAYESVWITTDPYMAHLHSSGRNRHGFFTGEAIAAGPDTSFDVAICELARLTGTASYSPETLMKTHVLQLVIGIADALSAIVDAREQQNPAAGRRVSHTVVRVLNYLKRNHTRTIRLADVAEELSVSPSHLNAVFKRERGETIIQCLEAYRIDVARKLLTHTENSVEQIAAHLAFCDQFHFSKTFKKKTGVSPMQYRRAAEAATEF